MVPPSIAPHAFSTLIPRSKVTLLRADKVLLRHCQAAQTWPSVYIWGEKLRGGEKNWGICCCGQVFTEELNEEQRMSTYFQWRLADSVLGLSWYYLFTSNAEPIFQPTPTSIRYHRIRTIHTFITFVVWSVSKGCIKWQYSNVQDTSLPQSGLLFKGKFRRF